jgi:hypothetical protein
MHVCSTAEKRRDLARISTHLWAGSARATAATDVQRYKMSAGCLTAIHHALFYVPARDNGPDADVLST